MDQVSHLDISSDAAAMLVLAGVETMFKSRPVWSAADIAIMRQHYSVSGGNGVARLLPTRTIGAIHWKARQLKLKKPPFKREVERYTTTPYIDEAIRRYYAGDPRKGGLSKLAHQVGRPVKWVAMRARTLAVQRPRFADTPWSEAEVAIVRQHAKRIPVVIAAVLRRKGYRRSPNAVALKLCRLRCDRTDDDHYSASGLAELFGVHLSTVSGWIAKGWLKAGRKGMTCEHDHYRIHHAYVRRFVIENVGAIDLRRVDKYWLIDLIAGS